MQTTAKARRSRSAEAEHLEDVGGPAAAAVSGGGGGWVSGWLGFILLSNY